MKVCQNCKKNPVNVKITEVVDGQKQQVFLCDECASKKGVAITAPLQSKIEPLVKKEESKPVKWLEKVTSLAKKEDRLICEDCGMTFELFQNTGLLGCPNDYYVFEQQLIQIMDKIHGAHTHRGKVPSSIAPDLAIDRQLMKLREQLQKAIEKEEYEKAAKLRDKIKELEGEENGS